MSIKLPGHDFPYWSDPSSDGCPPAVIVGAGLSADLVPLPFQLARDFAAKQDQIEKLLGINTGFTFTRKKPEDPLGQAEELYQWAERCIETLKHGGVTETAAKSSLIDAMGLLDDERFAANTNVPLRGTTPRHRVLARFARESCIHSLWSLNWDLWLEAAFDAVGLIRSPLSSTQPARSLPSTWLKAYEVWLPPNALSCNQRSIVLYKPHGCVRALYEGTNSTFRITEKELRETAPHNVQVRLQGDLSRRPVCSIGWGATEDNLQTIFETCAAASTLSGGLTVVALDWDDGATISGSRHSRLASNFGQDKSNTLCQVKPKGAGTTDELMQWIQALRCLRRFRSIAQGIAPYETGLIAQLAGQIQLFSRPILYEDSNSWALSWFDTFFPVWSRLCFISKVLVFQNDGDVPIDSLSLLPRDAHIPINDTTAKRWDILAGAQLYGFILDAGAAIQSELDFESYPGAFWHQSTRTLLVPIPIWTETVDISLAALKPLVESRHWAGMGRVERVCLLRVRGGIQNNDEATVTENARFGIWKQCFCSLMRLRAFVDVEKIDDNEAADLPTYLQSRRHAK